ncbi:MAG: 2-oxoglutarate dehydrogenase complex dihydrolipoyllysine-residue succinyltransferase [Hyphomicrobiaceae bacterium]
MAIEIRVPTLGESVTEATIGQWFKKPGESVTEDEALCELETDKVTIEVPAPTAGVLGPLSAQEGDTVEVGAVIASLNEGATASQQPEKTSEPTPNAASNQQQDIKPEPAVAAATAATAASGTDMPPSPAARRAAAEGNVDLAGVAGSGKRGQVLKHDVMVASNSEPRAQAGGTDLDYVPAQVPVTTHMRVPSIPDDSDREERVRMTRLRQTVAQRLKDAQNTAAILTTFNDVDMSAVMGMRKQYKDLFEKRHGIKLGFMGFFVKACLQALKEVPAVNAEIDGSDLIYKNYYHVGVAVGTPKGLVVPVVRDADQMSIAEIEGSIAEFGKKARDGKLGIEEMQGGTFTISNGGVYGSMLSTPILNAPQSGILGMHRIEERPVAVNGEVVVRPMMYLALSYDHRIVDGKEAVTFLVRVKECLEDPQRFILEL